MDKSGKTLTWTELRVGIVVIVSLAILAFTVLQIGSGGGSPFSAKYEVKALMADVNGLKTGAPVRVGGVEVGTVTGVDFAGRGGGGLVEVRMRLDSRVQDRVTNQSQATLGSLGLLGEKAVDISSAGSGVPLRDGEYLPAAAEDPFRGLLSDASDSTAHMRRILSRMDAGEGLIGKALRDEELYTRMLDVSVRLQAVLGKLESQNGPLGRLVNDRAMAEQLSGAARGIEAAVARIEAGEGVLGALSRNEELAGRLKSLTGRLDDLAERVQRGDGSLGRLMQDDGLARNVEQVSGSLDAVLTRLEKGEGSAGRLLHDPALYEDLSGALKELRGLLSDVRRDPRKYLQLKLSLF